jgi:3-isopropylmalate/(R)-2-methylmalate dehydratase small subunit
MTTLDQTLTGRAWTFGDSIDTTQLAGGGLTGIDARDTLRINCLRAVRPEFPDTVRAGDLVVAGGNFGCGSSRQTAVEALLLCGVAGVVAESVARIFRRNSIALAFPVFVVPGVSKAVADGDTISVDYPNRRLTNTTTGGSLPIESWSAGVEEVYAGGGLARVVVDRLTALGHPPVPLTDKGSV